MVTRSLKEMLKEMLSEPGKGWNRRSDAFGTCPTYSHRPQKALAEGSYICQTSFVWVLTLHPKVFSAVLQEAGRAGDLTPQEQPSINKRLELLDEYPSFLTSWEENFEVCFSHSPRDSQQARTPLSTVITHLYSIISSPIFPLPPCASWYRLQNKWFSQNSFLRMCFWETSD